MNSLKKGFLFNFIGSFTFAFTSMFFLIISTRIFGIEEAGIFAIAFSLGTLFICIGNYSSRTFQVTETDTKINDIDFFYHRLFTVSIMLILSFLYCIISGYSYYKILIVILVMFYKMLESFSEVLYGFMQKKDELYKVGLSYFIKGLSTIIAFALFSIFFDNLLISIISIVCVYLLCIIFFDFVVLKKYNLEYKKYNINAIKYLFKIGFGTFIFSFLTIYLFNASKFFIDYFLSDGYQTIYNIIVMPATVFFLLSQILVQPFINEMKLLILNNNITKVNELVRRLVFLILISGFLICICGFIFGIPVLNFVYSIELTSYKISFMLILVGSIFYALSFIYITIFTIKRVINFQVLIFTLISISTLFISPTLVLKFDIFGASLIFFIAMFFLFICYQIKFIFFYMYNNKLKN